MKQHSSLRPEDLNEKDDEPSQKARTGHGQNDGGRSTRAGDLHPRSAGVTTEAVPMKAITGRASTRTYQPPRRNSPARTVRSPSSSRCDSLTYLPRESTGVIT